MKRLHVIAVLLTAAVVLLVLGLKGLSSSRERQKGSQAPDTGLGFGLAEELVRLTGGQGEIVVLTGDPERDALPLRTFKHTLAKHPDLRLMATETLAGRFTPWPETDPLPAEKFLEVMSKYSTATLVISFVGVPHLEPAELATLSPGRPGIVIVYPDTFAPDPVWLDSGRVLAVISPRQNPPPLTEFMPQTHREWFDREFVVAHSNA